MMTSIVPSAWCPLEGATSSQLWGKTIIVREEWKWPSLMTLWYLMWRVWLLAPSETTFYWGVEILLFNEPVKLDGYGEGGIHPCWGRLGETGSLQWGKEGIILTGNDHPLMCAHPMTSLFCHLRGWVTVMTDMCLREAGVSAMSGWLLPTSVQKQYVAMKPCLSVK